jgi:O-antigen/teichoic acid export membrane protein
MSRRLLLKNSGANVARILAASLIALVLPPLLVRTLPRETYGTWILILQLSAYVGFFDFGVQTAVGRFVARTDELQDLEYLNRIVTTSFVILVGGSLLSLLMITGIAWQFPNLFRDLPQSLLGDARSTLILVGASLAIGLPASVFSGVFVGLQRSEIPVIISVITRFLGAILTAFVVYNNGSIVLMGAITALTNLVPQIFTYIACRRFVKDISLSLRYLSKKAAKDIFEYCYSLSIWSVSMLLVSGVDTTIVGYFDFKAVGAYGLAVTLTNFVIQIQVAIFSALIPAAAVLDAKANEEKVRRLLLDSTRYGIFILLFTGLPLLVWAKPILKLWVGSEYALQAAPFLQILVIANIIRLAGLPFSNLLLGTGQQRLVILSPIAEGVCNLIISLIATAHFGAIGSAFGTFCGAFVSIGSHVFYNLPRTKNLNVTVSRFVFEGLLRPLLCAIPSAILLLIEFLKILDAFQSLFLYLMAFIATLLIFWHQCLRIDEHQEIIGFFKKISLPKKA